MGKSDQTKCWDELASHSGQSSFAPSRFNCATETGAKIGTEKPPGSFSSSLKGLGHRLCPYRCLDS